MLREYAKRLIICISGLAFFALGNFFGVLAGSAGTNGWNTLSLGIAKANGLSFGTGVFLVSVAILLIDFFGKGKLGIGTFLNALLIPVFSDILLAVLTFVPKPPNMVIGVFYTLLGQLIIAFASVIYMSPGLGAGPRDTLMIICGKKLPKIPIGVIKFGLEILALIVGVILGAPFGIGTVLVVALQASFFQFACKVMRFEPRTVENEDLVDTWRRWMKAKK